MEHFVRGVKKKKGKKKRDRDTDDDEALRKKKKRQSFLRHGHTQIDTDGPGYNNNNDDDNKKEEANLSYFRESFHTQVGRVSVREPQRVNPVLPDSCLRSQFPG